MGLIVAFVIVAGSVELGWWVGPDHGINDWATRRRGTLIWHLAKVVVDVANPHFALSVVLALGLLISWIRRCPGVAWETVIRIGLVVIAVLLLKPLLSVPGPAHNPLGRHGGAFPSGHTTSTVVCVTLLLGWSGWPRGAWARLAIGFSAVATVGLAVVLVRYHYLSDVVGGALLGLLIALPNPPTRLRSGGPAVE